MRSLKNVFLVSLALVLLSSVVGTSQVQISREEALDQLLNDAYWAVSLYDGWLETEISLESELKSLSLLDDSKPRNTFGVTTEQLVQFYKRYDERAYKLYKDLSQNIFVSFDLKKTFILYQFALRDVIAVLEKEEAYTKADVVSMNEAYTSLMETGVRILELKEGCSG